MSGLGQVKYKMNLEYLVWAGRKCSKSHLRDEGERCDLPKNTGTSLMRLPKTNPRQSGNQSNDYNGFNH